VRPLTVATCDLDAAIVRGPGAVRRSVPARHEFVAEVIDAGDDVTGVQAGERYAIPVSDLLRDMRELQARADRHVSERAAARDVRTRPVGGDWAAR